MLFAGHVILCKHLMIGALWHTVPDSQAPVLQLVFVNAEEVGG